MNLQALLTGIMHAVPFAVQAVEHLYPGTPGATKKQKALAILSDGLQGAAAVDPALVPLLNASTSVISTAIDGIVGIMNLIKHAPAAAPATQAPQGT